MTAARASQMLAAGPNRCEAAGYAILDSLGVEYEPQAPMFGKFVVDGLIPSLRVVVQWDGDYWHGRDPSTHGDKAVAKQMALDRSQDAYLAKAGYVVFRAWETDLLTDPLSVEAKLRALLVQQEHALEHPAPDRP